MYLVLFNFITITLLASTVPTLALPITSSQHLQTRAAGDTAASILLQIAPRSASCDGADFPAECATNTQAAPHLIQAMIDYKIGTYQEMAAILALIAFESGEFRYNTNHFPSPGRPGQGTRSMFMPSFVVSYAQSIPALSSSLAATNPTDLNAIRALVLPDEYSWASAAWFLTTQCASIRPQLQAGGQAGFEAYMGCVGTAATGERLEYWNRAVAAFGI